MTRECATPTGYQTVFPKFVLERAVPVRFVYAALSGTDADTMVAFLRGLATETEPGCFRWRPPWSLADQAFGFVDAFAFEERDLGMGGPRSITFEALQLTGATP